MSSGEGVCGLVASVGCSEGVIIVLHASARTTKVTLLRWWGDNYTLACCHWSARTTWKQWGHFEVTRKMPGECVRRSWRPQGQHKTERLVMLGNLLRKSGILEKNVKYPSSRPNNDQDLANIFFFFHTTPMFIHLFGSFKPNSNHCAVSPVSIWYAFLNNKDF